MESKAHRVCSGDEAGAVGLVHPELKLLLLHSALSVHLTRVDCGAYRQLPVVEVWEHEAVTLLAIGADDHILGIDRTLR